MKLFELLLVEEPLQAAVKRLLKPAGTLADVLGRDAGTAATLLGVRGKGANPKTKAFVLKGGSPLADRLIQSLINGRPFARSRSDDHGELRVMRMPGGALLLAVGGDDPFVVTTDDQAADLVESYFTPGSGLAQVSRP